MLLVSGWLSPSSVVHPTKHHLTLDMELRIQDQELLRIDLSPSVQIDRSLDWLEPLEEIVFTTCDWVGVTLNDHLAVLLNLRLGGHATSPDPARPNVRNAIDASVGIAMRTD